MSKFVEVPEFGGDVSRDVCPMETTARAGRRSAVLRSRAAGEFVSKRPARASDRAVLQRAARRGLARAERGQVDRLVSLLAELERDRMLLRQALPLAVPEEMPAAMPAQTFEYWHFGPLLGLLRRQFSNTVLAVFGAKGGKPVAVR